MRSAKNIMDTDLGERQTISFDFSGVLKALRAFSEIYNKLIPPLGIKRRQNSVYTAKLRKGSKNEKYKKALRAYDGI